VPTAAEYGYAEFARDIWFGVIAPAKTPKQAILQLSEWFSAAMRISEVRESSRLWVSIQAEHADQISVRCFANNLMISAV
jgi:tripartite-type tricarboxylate transporter receptor subunit TctC